MQKKILDVVNIELEKGIASGVSIETPEAPILLILTQKGFIMCGVLDVEGLDALLPGKMAAAKISGVRTFEDLLTKKVVTATEKAQAMGVSPGMVGKEALNCLM